MLVVLTLAESSYRSQGDAVGVPERELVTRPHVMPT